MTNRLVTDRLYKLLPTIYRLRDADNSEGLRALLNVMEVELQALEADIQGLYDDWFIETSSEWVVPYIGDTLGVRGLHSSSSSEFSLRAYVANTLAYRRRKGTATMLEQLARDVTGWDARVVEFFELLGTTQYLNHLRPYNLRTPDFRNANALELLDTPFDNISHTADIRHIANAGLKPAPIGRYNLPNIGICLWRLQAYTVEQGDAFSHPAGPEFYTFNPLGIDQPLFNPPRTEAEITHLAEEINVPAPLRRRPLFSELENMRQAVADNADFSPDYFDADSPVVQIFVDNNVSPIPSERVLTCDLSDWRNPPVSKDYTKSDGTTLSLPIEAAIDPVLGRLAFPSGVTHNPVRLSYAYGFSGDLGGGPYNRSETVFGALKSNISWQVGVSHRQAAVPGEIFNTLVGAVNEWNSQPAGTVGMIVIMDSCTYQENLTGTNAIQIPEGSQLSIVAADWPAVEDPITPGVYTRTIGELTPDELRPYIRGNISVHGSAPGNDPNPGELVIDGLLIEGDLTVLVGNLGGLQLNHCTLIPGTADITVHEGISSGTKNSQLNVALSHSIVGQISLPESVPSFSSQDSILDGAGLGAALEAPGSNVSISECTVFGALNARSLEASNSIFTGVVIIERRQTGCARYCFVADGSSTPRRYRCQPDLAYQDRAEEISLESANDLPPDERLRIYRRVNPGFNSIHYGDPDYAQLSREVGLGASVMTGAEDGSEIGVFSYLKQPQREANLRASLDEYLRFGLEAGVFFVT